MTRTEARALVDAGYAPLRAYIEEFGTMTDTDTAAPQPAPGETCPTCGGSGRQGIDWEFMRVVLCTRCDGTGRISPAPAEECTYANGDIMCMCRDCLERRNISPTPAAPAGDEAEALKELLHAVCGETGFAAAVRTTSGLAYPWPALDIAEAKARAALAATQPVPAGDAVERALDKERIAIANQARIYAGYYPQSSDGRNSFVMLIEWIEARTALAAVQPAPAGADQRAELERTQTHARRIEAAYTKQQTEIEQLRASYEWLMQRATNQLGEMQEWRDRAERAEDALANAKSE